MRFNTLHHIHKMLQNGWRKSFLNTQNLGAYGRGALGAPYQGSALDPLETLSGPQTPRRLSSPLTHNPGSAPEKAPVATVVIQSCHWNHVGKLLFHKISTILFVAVPLIFIYIQVSDSGSQEPLVNISVIMTYNLEQVILFCIICITPWYDRSVIMLRTEAC